ncbi:MAG: B12-binding domain-containing radical SAM protein [Clostridia bacterium]|nr:B12-binding domain-containing radical SAM protein [Clostridia bacterium]
MNYGETVPVERKPYVLLFFIQRILFKNSFEYIDPLGLMALAAFIGEKGYNPGVFSGTVTEAAAVLEREIKKRTVSAVGLYCDFENQSVVESFSSYVKEHWGIPVIVGGPQAVALSKEFITSSGCFAVARGEGEYTLWELLEYIVHNKGSIEGIAGITYINEKGDLKSNPDRSLITDLDALPFQNPSHSLTQRKNNFSLLTGRGCPFHCAFCYEGGNTKTVRLRSVQNVTAEIIRLFDQNPYARYVWFSDDTFTLNTSRVLEFCTELTRLREKKDFVWFCEGHPSTLVKEPGVIRQMVDAGLVRMQIGIESGSRHVIEQYRKQTTLEQIEEVILLCREADLPQLCGNIIIGGAGETLETIEETWAYIDKLLSLAPGMLDISLTLFMPFPGTAMTRCPRKFGMDIVDPDALTSIGDYPVASTEKMELGEIASARRMFTHRMLERMSELVDRGLVPHRDIIRHYRLNADYGISSIWHRAIYSQKHFLHRRYMLLAGSSAKRMEDIDSSQIDNYRPVRVFTLWNGISWRGDIPEILGYVLSPLEYELILLCSGKLKLWQVVDEICRKFSGRYENSKEAREIIMKILKEFEGRNWLVFVPY